MDFSTELHDAHTSHYDGVRSQSQSTGHSADRAVRLYREPLSYPSRVVVSAPLEPCRGIVGQMEGVVEGGVGNVC